MPSHIKTSSTDDLSIETSFGDDSSIETSSSDDLTFWTKRDLKFRVLILGRANAGKTTILERVAGAAISEAKVRRDGETLPDQMIKGQNERGLHNVEDEIYFHSRPGFVFHDSRGVEAGSDEELSTVQQFVENHSSTTDLDNQLHVIWMCIPLDESRELFEGESVVFSLVERSGSTGCDIYKTRWRCGQGNITDH
ncbi:hypothetical protein C8R44DRAFT_712101 [Mycena epipterygia]|nr:hypothetical protein C8R44DRAFT_712101 [Mycena epipterygia]